jgi:hypothetical protein
MSPGRQREEIAAFLGADLGRPLARLTAPSSRGAAEPGEPALLRKYCTTAPMLGYEL